MRPPRRLLTTILPFLIMTGMSACTTASTHDDAIRTVRIYDLLRAFPRATLNVHDPSYVARNEYSVDGEVRAGVFLHPASSITFPPARISPESVLNFKIGIMDSAWDKEGDGVEFTITVESMNHAATKIFSRYLDPKHNSDDRRWFDERISLRQFGDHDIRIVLATSPGPAGDYRYDWSVFAEPHIVLGPVP